MTRTWGSTGLGKVFTSTKPWSLSLDADRFALEIEGRQHDGSVLLLDGLTVKPGALWASVRIEGVNGQQRLLDGIPNRDARQMQQEIAAAIAVVRRQQQIAAASSEFEPAVKSVQAWVADAKRACDQELRLRGWLGHEFQTRWASIKPQGLGKLLLMPELEEHLSRQSDLVKGSVALWRRSFAEVADGINKRHVAKELVDSRAFFEHVEKSPLTQEQAEAVLCFDNRVLLVASAGSGKTSTMVAKAGYALKKNYFAPDRMLLLAFNNDAAAELRDRCAGLISADTSIGGIHLDEEHEQEAKKDIQR